MTVEFTDRSAEFLSAMQEAALRALEKCGLVAEGYAKKLQQPDTGLLRNSITHAISGEVPAIQEYKADKPRKGQSEIKKGSYSGTAPKESGGEMSVYIGTNVEYAVYVEMGTGKAHVAGGRDTPWSYKDANGKRRTTSGHQAKPFIKPAVADHVQTYKQIIEAEMKGG